MDFNAKSVQKNEAWPIQNELACSTPTLLLENSQKLVLEIPRYSKN